MTVFFIYLVLCFGGGIAIRKQPAWLRVLLLLSACVLLMFGYLYKQSLW